MNRSVRKLRILVVDDHEVVRWGLGSLLVAQAWVKGCVGAGDADEALRLAARHRPHVAVLDLFLGRASTVDLCREITEAGEITRVLLISGAGTIPVAAARAAGASGFVRKEAGLAEVMRAVRTVGMGGEVFDPEPVSTPGDLSPREREVLELMAAGDTNREIAAHLHLSPHTVKDHTTAILRKLEARNRTDAVERARRLGLLGQPR
jgi:DNA-binding NarL/FixJ family response regulator